jgi:serine/threonine protein kinase/tetratricopeptide (TPR) repeat protein
VPIDPVRVKALFQHTIKLLDPAARRAFLDSETADDPALRERVDALLAAPSGLDGPLIAPDGIGDADRTHTLTEPCGPSPSPLSIDGNAPGTVLAGRYELVEQIGEGTYGSVWSARQTTPVKRMVAVKLIKAGVDSKTVLARFEAERQALALMNHENIAQVYDAGISEQGRPFYVMELVNGGRITKFCDDRRLDVQARLNLFLEVCSAVHYAHQQKLIHRDLKPSNILVKHDGDAVMPKVIDFGLVKAIDGTSLTDHALRTMSCELIGTPVYMAPEQAARDARNVNARADIYALGVILYELLTGSNPIPEETWKNTTMDELLRMVREVEPPLPSNRLSTSAALKDLAAARQTEPMRLTRLVGGDLDWVVMKALAKELGRRYKSVAELAEDLKRFLNHEPVSAGPPGVWYRTQKFVERHPGLVAGVAIVIGTLVAGVVGTTVGMFEAQRQERRAVASADAANMARQAEMEQRKLAEQKGAEAEAVVKFIEDKVLAAARPRGQDGGLGRDATLRAMIDAAEPAIGGGFKDQPLVEARIRFTLGNTYAYLGDYASAVVQLERCRSISVKQLGHDHPITLRSMHNLAAMLIGAGRMAGAIRLCDEVLTARRRVLGPDHPETLSSMLNLASCYADVGRSTEALRLREDALAGRRRVLGPDHPETLAAMGSLAISYADSDRLADAIKLEEEVLVGHRRIYGPDHPITLHSMHNLSIGLAADGRPADASRLREDALAGRRRVLGPDHPDTLMSMHGLACSYSVTGRPIDAVNLHEEVLSVRRRVLGPDHPHTLKSMSSLANSYEDADRPADALRVREEALAACRRVFGPDHPETLWGIHALAISYAATNRPADALRLREDVLTTRRRVLGPDHPDTFWSMQNLAISYFDLGHMTDAIKLHEDALAARWRILGSGHPDTLTSMHHLANSYHAGGHMMDALRLREATLTARKRVLGPYHKYTLDSLHALAISLYTITCHQAVTAEQYSKEYLPVEAAAAADRAMAWLTKAVGVGYADRARLEADLTVLRGRADFRKLVASMPESAPPPRPAGGK